MKEAVRDRSGKVIGYYETDGNSGRVWAIDASGRRLAFFDERSDQTYETNGRLFARGNALASFIYR